MGIIKVEGIKFRAHHGCMDEEAKIGGMYIVDVMIDTDFEEASQRDELSKTIDYCEVYEVVKTEMAIRSKLIEHVAQRILTQLQNRFVQLHYAEVKLTKLSPPINGDVEKVSVVLNSGQGRLS
jgi:dihydroneopterin aldolase